MYFFCGDAHGEEGTGGKSGGNGDGVGDAVDLFLAACVAVVGVRGRNGPAAVFVVENVFLEALMGGASIADEDASVALDLPARGEAGAREGDEGVGVFFTAELAGDEAIEGEGVGVA